MSLARSLCIALFALVPLSVAAQDASLPACIEVQASARWGADAYNHYVRLANGCDRRARCTVATDVNPEPQAVEVGPHASVEVLTFRGSPASVFTPNVRCELVR